MSKRPALPVLIALCLATATLARAETVQSGSLRVSFDGKISPHTLPRQGKAPVEVSVGTKIAAVNGKTPPQLRQMEIAINRNGVLDTRGLPVCPLEEIQPSTTADALERCRGSLIGEGLFSAKVLLKGQTSFPSAGKLHAFNSRIDGHSAILAHVYGAQPAPASFTLVFKIRRAKGTFGTVLTASMPEVSSGSGYVTGLSMRLGKTFSQGGRRHSYLSAGCPAPKGFPGASFPLARASFVFAGGRTLGSTITRSCRATG